MSSDPAGGGSVSSGSQAPLPVTRVEGGAGGTRVVVDDVAQLGALCREAAAAVGEGEIVTALARATAAVEGTAALSPLTAARAGAALARCGIGPGSPLASCAGAEALGVGLGAAASAYDATEQAATALVSAMDEQVVAVELGVAVTLPEVAVGVVAAEGVTEAVAIGDAAPERVADAWVGDHVDLLQHEVDGMAGLLADRALPGGAAFARAAVGGDSLGTPVAAVAHAAAPLWSRGRPDVGAPSQPVTTAGPRDLTDLVADLRETNDATEDRSTIALRTVTSRTPAGERQALVVDVPGTKMWEGPGDRVDVAADTGGNLTEMGGDGSAYAEGVEQAVIASGVSRSTPVALVAHSQGGMTSTTVARDLRARGYDVTTTVAVASPVGGMPQPAGTRGLCLENERDVVPALDGRDDGDQAFRTTVSFRSDVTGVGPNHGLDTYVRGARSVDAYAARDRSVSTFLAGMRDDGFLAAPGERTTQTVRRVTISVRR